jgi:hypothetical protein
MNNNTIKAKREFNEIINSFYNVAERRKDSETLIQLSLINYEMELIPAEQFVQYLRNSIQQVLKLLENMKVIMNGEKSSEEDLENLNEAKKLLEKLTGV